MPMLNGCLRRFLAAGLAVLTAVLASTGALAVTLERGNDADPETLDPHKTSTVAEAHILRDLFEGLVIHDMAGNTVPGVAERWTRSDDGFVYTFHLRANAKWSNGDPVSAEDFVFSLRRIMAPETGSKYSNVLYPIRGAEAFNKGLGGARAEDMGLKAIDARTLEITLQRPTPYFMELLTHTTALPVHRGSIGQHGAQWVRPGNLVSNGAYRLVEFVPNGHIRVVKNMHFHAAAEVKIDEVRFHPSPDSAVAARRFMAGELHMTTDIPADQVQFLRGKLGDQVRIAPYLGTFFLVIKSSKKPFDDVRVRRALAMAIDREFVADEIWGGTMLPAYGMVPPGVANYGDKVEADFAELAPAAREAEAKRLMAEAGFGPGKPLRLEIRYNVTDNNRRTVVAVADQWKRIGVETRFISTDAKTHFAHLRDGGDFDVARYGWIADYSDPQSFLFLLLSDNVGFNVGRYASAEYDAAMKQADQIIDIPERAKVLARAEAIFLRDMPWIPILFYSTRNLVSSKLVGFQSNTRGAYASRFLSLKP